MSTKMPHSTSQLNLLKGMAISENVQFTRGKNEAKKKIMAKSGRSKLLKGDASFLKGFLSYTLFFNLIDLLCSS